MGPRAGHPVGGLATGREEHDAGALSEAEAIRLLHAPDRGSITGIRDHAMLFVFFKTAARCQAIAGACVGHVERTDTDYYLAVSEKGGKNQRKALLEAAPAVLGYIEAAGIGDDPEGPLFRPVVKDRKTLLRRHLERSSIRTAVAAGRSRPVSRVAQTVCSSGCRRHARVRL